PRQPKRPATELHARHQERHHRRLRRWTITCVTSDEQLIRRATAALENADWETAKRLFSDAVDRRETPEALEGLARAAFFLNEGEAALEARERAYARYREADQPVNAARMAIALAWDHRAARGERRSRTGGWHARGGCSTIRVRPP